MANRPAPAQVLRPGDHEELERWTRATTISAGALKRARIVLLAAEGVANSRISEVVGVSLPTVMLWRGRYESQGIKGLADVRRPAGPHDRSGGDRDRDADPAAEEARGYSLVDPAAGQAAGAE